MTVARQQWKRWLVITTLVTSLAAGPAAFGNLVPFMQSAAAQDIEVNPNTGLAISGFDPVAYFVDHAPRMGRPDIELSLDGTIWQFRNSGNRDAFAAHPNIYMPRFGGYDPVAIANGTSVAGNPLFWAVVRQRLYLFYDSARRDAFLTDPGRILITAERKWPQVARTIGH